MTGDWRGFKGLKKKTSVGLLVFNPLWSEPLVPLVLSSLCRYTVKKRFASFLSPAVMPLPNFP